MLTGKTLEICHKLRLVFFDAVIEMIRFSVSVEMQKILINSRFHYLLDFFRDVPIKFTQSRTGLGCNGEESNLTDRNNVEPSRKTNGNSDDCRSPTFDHILNSTHEEEVKIFRDSFQFDLDH